jgi:hypothetical protein
MNGGGWDAMATDIKKKRGRRRFARQLSCYAQSSTAPNFKSNRPLNYGTEAAIVRVSQDEPTWPVVTKQPLLSGRGGSSCCFVTAKNRA